MHIETYYESLYLLQDIAIRVKKYRFTEAVSLINNDSKLCLLSFRIFLSFKIIYNQQGADIICRIINKVYYALQKQWYAINGKGNRLCLNHYIWEDDSSLPSLYTR